MTEAERCFLCGYKREKHERLCLYSKNKPWDSIRKLKTNAFGRTI